MPARPPLAIVYEHPEWFKPLFATLDRRGIPYRAIRFEDHLYDLADRTADTDGQTVRAAPCPPAPGSRASGRRVPCPSA